MKKKIILTLAMVAFAANAYAALTVSVPAGIQFVPSKNVNVGYEPDDLGGTNMIVYAIASKNAAGDKIFGATSASSAMGYKTGTAGATLGTGDGPGVPTTTSDSALTGGFSLL